MDFDPTLAMTDSTYENRLDTTIFNGVKFLTSGSFNVRPDIFLKAINIYPGDVYDAEQVKKAYDNLMRFNYFKTAVFTFRDVTDSTDNQAGRGEIDFKINCTPRLKQGYKLEVEATTSSDYYGLLFTVGYTNRNLMKGIETLDLNLTGGYEIITSTDGGSGHSHTVNSHKHSITVNPNSSFVSSTVSVYSTLTSAMHKPHSHTNTTVAGSPTTLDSFKVVNGGSTDTFIKSLKDSDPLNTSEEKLTTNSNSGTSLATSTQVSGNKEGGDVKTETDGNHNHSVTTTTDVSVITGVTVATSVVVSASLNYTKPTVASTVLTSVSYSAPQSSVVTSWSCAVDASGILSFNTSTGNRVTGVTIGTSSADQSAGSCSLDAPRVSQTFTSGKVGATGTAASGGSHTHGFNHTHTIPSHTHTIPSHSHTYVKSVQDQTGSAYKSLTSSYHTPHSHSDVTVAGAHSDDKEFKYIDGGEQTLVVKNLKNENF